MKTIVHINRHRIANNRKTGNRDPVITVKTYKSNQYADEVIIRDKFGNEVARIIYRPDKPLSCGAACWIESYEQVEVIPHAKCDYKKEEKKEEEDDKEDNRHRRACTLLR